MTEATPKIVILDAYCSNPGDLSWEPLAKLGDLEVYDRSTPDEAITRAAPATAILTNKVPIDDNLLAASPSVVYAGVLATGFNVVDLDACRRRGVTVTNIPGYSTESTAQHAFALLLELTNRVGEQARTAADRWPTNPDFSVVDKPLMELDGKTCGVIGFGAIGKAFARRAVAFGMNVLATTANPDKHRQAADELGVRFCALHELLAQSDVVSLHCPLTPATENLIGEANLRRMKDGALLVNTGRGQLVDSAAVVKALQSGKLGGAAVDVLRQEPPRDGDPLLGADGVLVTPHVAWATTAARRRLIDIVAGNFKAFLDGSPRNVVS